MPADVRPCDLADVPTLGDNLARALRADPVFEYLVPDIDHDERARRLGPFFRATVQRAEPRDAPHWYLVLLGTAPKHQGRGHGGAAIAPVLERCDREGVPAYPESSKESNVAFYERHGFKVPGELRPAPDGPTPWPMWREPR